LPYPHLGSPLKLRGLTLKNRILSAPASLAELDPGGRLSPENIEFYKLRAAGGCALVTVGDSIVDTPTGKSHPMQIALDSPDSVPSLKACADAIHAHNAHASIELDHGGALCDPLFLGRNAIGPSGYVDAWGDTIEEMDEAEIKRLAESFGEAAAQAKFCGFDMVMIHGGHGWLLHQFMSPLTNRRTDKYGGNLENRMRFSLMALAQVRDATGANFPIEFRMSGDERTPGGYTIQTGIEIAKLIDEKVDLIHVSAGTQADEYSAILMHPGVFQKEGENASYASAIKKHVKTPVVTVGGFCGPGLMEQTLAAGNADAIALGRALLADPFLPKKLFAGFSSTPCVRCGECQSSMMANRNIRCSVNPLIGREGEFFRPLPIRARKRVLIAGGGPAGMQAAITLHERGHETILCESSDRLGGMLNQASSESFKSGLRRYLEHQISKTLSLPIDIRLSTRVGKALAEEASPEAIIIAVGAEPIKPNIAGVDSPHVFQCACLAKTEFIPPQGGRVVIIGGGLVGCEQAVELARNGVEVTIMEMGEHLAKDCGRMHRINLLRQISNEPLITAATGAKCVSISREAVFGEKAGQTLSYPADAVLLAVGMTPRTDAVDELRPLAKDSYVIGDALQPRNLLSAVRGGYDAAQDIGLFC
jgi:2,4-dienoyl-CoA reductase-like NADH-dependent reductase (Old Yellow Enzyme family)/thioredoxin reductase